MRASWECDPSTLEEERSADNIFRIADELVGQVDKTKKYVVFMIIAIIVAIPVSWHVSPLLLGTPYNFMLAGIVFAVANQVGNAGSFYLALILILAGAGYAVLIVRR